VSDPFALVRVGSEAYAVPVAHVVEVDELGDITTIPGAPATAMGVHNMRGQLLPVFDLASVLGIGREGRATGLLVAEEHGQLAGLAVDQITDVASLPDALQEVESELLLGATLVDGSLVGVIDVPRLFAALERAAA
jgi:chemotaxis signal transduction protein